MPRPGATGALLTALQAGSLQPAIFVSIQFATVTVYLWTGGPQSPGAASDGSIAWNGQTWQGRGTLLGFGPMESGATVQARGINLILSGLDASLLTDYMTEFQLGMAVTIYFTGYSSGSLIATPITTWAGRTDRPTFGISGPVATVAMACENRLLDMNLPVSLRHTNEQQQALYPGDVGLSFVDAVQDFSLFVAGQANTTSFL